MACNSKFRIAVLPGDGIGPEVMAPAVDLMARAVARVGGLTLKLAEHAAGANEYLRSGTALPEATVEAARAADAVLLGAMGLPDVRYPDGTEIVPQIELRMILDLYAGVRPVRAIPGLPIPLGDPRAREMDFVIIRESTEGLFAAMGKTERTEAAARDTMVITRKGSERLFDFALALGRTRKAADKPGRVTCVDKANVFGSFAFFREIFEERARAFPDVTADLAYVDAMAATMIRNPWTLDVLVTENMFGDILSDAGAALMGGMGVAPSADIGDRHAVFQPCHGTAPDIAGSGKANPTAMILSAAMMLEWLGERHAVPRAQAAGRLLDAAVTAAFAGGDLRPVEMGGDSGLDAIADAVGDALDSA